MDSLAWTAVTDVTTHVQGATKSVDYVKRDVILDGKEITVINVKISYVLLKNFLSMIFIYATLEFLLDKVQILYKYYFNAINFLNMKTLNIVEITTL